MSRLIPRARDSASDVKLDHGERGERGDNLVGEGARRDSRWGGGGTASVTITSTSASGHRGAGGGGMDGRTSITGAGTWCHKCGRPQSSLIE